MKTLFKAQAIVCNTGNGVTKPNAMIVNNDQIEVIGHYDELKSQTHQKEISLDQHILCPGLINAHGHAAMSLLRGFADDLPLMQWLEDKIWPLESQWVNDQFVFDGTQLAIAEMLRSGTTCFSDMYFFPESAIEAIEQSGIKAQLSFPIFDFPCNWGTGADDYLKKGEALIQKHLSNPNIQVIPGPHAPYTVNNENLKAAKALADQYDLPLQMHLHETAFEVMQSIEEHGKRPIERAFELGLIDNKFQAVHMTQLTDSDIELCKQAQLSVIHCPESNLKLASGFMPCQQLLDAGINVALGTDGAASNNDLDLFGEMRTAALLAKGVSLNPEAVNASQALSLATSNGAKALRMSNVKGCLEVGAPADFIAIEVNQLEQQPFYDALSLLTYSNISPRVSHSYINGVCLLDNHKFTKASGLDEERIIEKSQSWQKRIQDAH